jgi:hypothetical protein
LFNICSERKQCIYVKEIEKFPEEEHSDIKKINDSVRRKIKDFYQEISISTKKE